MPHPQNAIGELSYCFMGISGNSSGEIKISHFEISFEGHYLEFVTLW